MQDRNDRKGERFEKGKKPPRKSRNIQFARSLNSEQLTTLLQEKLLKARNSEPEDQEVPLMTELVHDIKFRLTYYARLYGEVDRDAYEATTEDRG